MTDKKKRGRPPGSKGKPKTLSSFKELQEVMNEEVASFTTTRISENQVLSHVSNSKGEITPFPEDWDKLGKIDKVQWLTANRK